MDEVLTDRFNKKILLSDIRWKHITIAHPEMKKYRKEIVETVSESDLIRQSIYSKSVYLYYRHFPNILQGKYMVAVVKANEDKFVITAYITDKIKRGEETWKKD